jgi:tetratricopeptide (TPR) repeat protein
VSVAWFSRLYRLNEAGKFDEVVTASEKYLTARPKDYALHLQRAKALLSLGRLDEAAVHLGAAVKGSKGFAAWPWFYRAALHARNGERKEMYGAMQTTLRLDPKLVVDFEQSPFFAAHWTSRPFRAVLEGRVDHHQVVTRRHVEELQLRSSPRVGAAATPASPRVVKSRKAVPAHRRPRA